MALAEIPHPAGWPLVGNISDIDPVVPILSLNNLADQYGPIYSLNIFGKKRVIISSVALLNEVCNEQRFDKCVAAALEQVRNGTHDGLFTAYPGEHNWELAHRILVPAFGPLSIRSMFDDMKDIASQLVLKWARHGPSYQIPVTDDFTRLTLDTLALCSMDYRFNSFYKEEMHPFVDSMVNFLTESGNRTRRPGLIGAFYRTEEVQYWKDIEYMRILSLELVQNRKNHPEDRNDLLNAMINGKDIRTGEKLSEDSIADNMITFLIAGHETTSGMLSFVFHYLLKNPAAYRKAQAEVDKVVGQSSIQIDHISKLPYVTAVLRETLRLQPTAPAFALQAKNDTEIIGGQYHISKNEPIVALLPKVHRDPAVYGEDANEFRPERMLDENFNKLPPNAWKPFGNGMRGCIGRPFAWQEALLVTAMLLQYFDFAADDPQYTLHLKQSLTIKPKDFYMRATLRPGLTATQVEQSLSSSIHNDAHAAPKRAHMSSTVKKGKPMTILYGSNTGTCQAFAQSLAADAPTHGYEAKVDCLDAAVDKLPTDHPVAIITASYEGAPCDNAARFFEWLDALKADNDVPVDYAVFGAGHSDWKETFHRIPTKIDEILEAHKGRRICQRGGTDAAKGDMFSEFESWSDDTFWPAMASAFGASDTSADAVGSSQGRDRKRPILTPQGRRSRGKVSDARILSAPDGSQKRHIEIELPSDMQYKSGDYLAILPINPQETFQRVMRHFNLAWDSVLTISARGHTTLPTNTPISATDLFGAYVELSQPATRRNLVMLSEACKDITSKTELDRLGGDSFSSDISEKRVSLLDLLDRFSSIQLPLGHFIAALPPMRTRSYSISSSPLWNPKRVTLTYAVLDEPSTAGAGRHIGVASNYLSKLAKGDTLHVSVRPSNQAFHLPTDAENTPVIMIAAGTGLAPFRGFISERAAQVGAGRSLAPALLFLGCRSPDQDELYRAELDAWEKMGAVQIHRAYSQKPEASNGMKYAQDAFMAEKAQVLDLWDRGSRVYVCGSRRLERSIHDACVKLYMERAAEMGKAVDEAKADAWFESLRNARFATDVFT